MDKKCIAPWDKENCLDKSNCPVYSHEHFCQYAVDVEPSPKDKLAEEMRNDKEFMAGVERGLQAVREGKVRAWDDIKKELDIEPEPMPLIKIDPHIYSCPSDAELGAEAQRDADMAWHLEKVQQVRKGLIEEVCKLLDDELRIISPNTEAKLKAHLRVMAEKE